MKFVSLETEFMRLTRLKHLKHPKHLKNHETTNTQKLHNGYLEKHKSIYSDSFCLKPYLIDEDMNRKKKQPKFIKTGTVSDLLLMGNSLKNDDAQYARTSFMFQSCGGFK